MGLATRRRITLSVSLKKRYKNRHDSVIHFSLYFLIVQSILSSLTSLHLVPRPERSLTDTTMPGLSAESYINPHRHKNGVSNNVRLTRLYYQRANPAKSLEKLFQVVVSKINVSATARRMAY